MNDVPFDLTRIGAVDVLGTVGPSGNRDPESQDERSQHGGY